MADRLDFYFRQRVTELELDTAFELLEKADRNFATDLAIYGIVAGALPTQHTPVPNLTIDLTAPGRGYDRLGQRIFFGTGQNINCAVDLVGIPTTVQESGNERWLGIFLRFKRDLSDPRTDGNSQTVYFRRDESFEIVVRQGLEAASGSGVRVPLQPDELLICDILLTAGQTQILNASINTLRRQSFVFGSGSSLSIQPGTWTILAPVSNTVQSAFDVVDSELQGHFAGTSRRHDGTAILHTAHGWLGSANVQATLDEIVDDLASSTSGSAGAIRVGADAVPGTPNALSAGTVDSQLSSLLSFVNNHLGTTTGAHAATATSVLDSGNKLNAVNVETALAEILEAYDDQHFRGNESDAGKHRAIIQPSFGVGAPQLLWESLGQNTGATHMRMYMEGEGMRLTFNAAWDPVNSVWQPDDPFSYNSGGAFFGRNDIQFFHHPLGASTGFADFTRYYRLAISGGTTNFFCTGPVSESGRCGLMGTNTFNAARTMALGDSVTFRSTFATAPSTVTLGLIARSTNYTTTPTVLFVTQEGFAYEIIATVDQSTAIYWFGTYFASP